MEWMIYVPGDNNKAYSRNCESEMHAQHGELVSHAKAEKKKKRKEKHISGTLTIPTFF